MQRVHARYFDEMQLAALRVGPVNDGNNAETKQRSAVVYTAVASLLSGRRLGIFKGVVNRDGYETWRLFAKDPGLGSGRARWPCSTACWRRRC
eukprot:15479307-Alexandrium_andersonii.AAC.1